MKLIVKNIGVIRDAEIKLDGITLLAGYNGTGKSTVSKALYGITEGYSDLENKIISARSLSIRVAISDFFRSRLGQLMYDAKDIFPLSERIAKRELTVPDTMEAWEQLSPGLFRSLDRDSLQLAKKLFPSVISQVQDAVARSDSDYIKYVVEEAVLNIFDGQISTIGRSEPGEILLDDKIFVQIADNRIMKCTEFSIGKIVSLYIESAHVLDEVWNGLNAPKYQMADFLTQEKQPDRMMSLEETEKQQLLLQKVDAAIHGKLIVKNGTLLYQDEKYHDPISISNMASGNKTVAVIRNFVEKNIIRSGRILIIDEPETNLHPEWQLKFAEVLVLLHKELGVRMLLNTHSTYFFRAIEVYSRDYDLENYCHYYMTEPAKDAENMYNVVNVDSETQRVYHAFYLPFEEL